MEITNAWKETRRVSLARFTDDVALGYLEWKAKWGGNITLPPRDESIKPINPQPKKTLFEAEILRQELQEGKRKLIKKNQRHQEEIGDWKFMAEVDKVKIQRMAKEWNIVMDNFNLENKRLRGNMKYGYKHPQKKVRVFEKRKKR